MIAKTSSYEKNNFREIFGKLVEYANPRLIVEFGIGCGYSLRCWDEFASKRCQIQSYDLFDEFPYHHASYGHIKKEFGKNKRIKIGQRDLFDWALKYKGKPIDILHIDIANNGNIYQFAIEHCMSKISKNGIMIMEGGAIKRDNVWWMKKFNKRKINPYLMEIANQYDITIVDKFPSLTIIKNL